MVSSQIYTESRDFPNFISVDFLTFPQYVHVFHLTFCFLTQVHFHSVWPTSASRKARIRFQTFPTVSFVPKQTSHCCPSEGKLPLTYKRIFVLDGSVSSKVVLKC